MSMKRGFLMGATVAIICALAFIPEYSFAAPGDPCVGLPPLPDGTDPNGDAACGPPEVCDENDHQVVHLCDISGEATGQPGTCYDDTFDCPEPPVWGEDCTDAAGANDQICSENGCDEDANGQSYHCSLFNDQAGSNGDRCKCKQCRGEGDSCSTTADCCGGEGNQNANNPPTCVSWNGGPGTCTTGGPYGSCDIQSDPNLPPGCIPGPPPVGNIDTGGCNPFVQDSGCQSEYCPNGAPLILRYCRVSAGEGPPSGQGNSSNGGVTTTQGLCTTYCQEINTGITCPSASSRSACTRDIECGEDIYGPCRWYCMQSDNAADPAINGVCPGLVFPVCAQHLDAPNCRNNFGCIENQDWYIACPESECIDEGGDDGGDGGGGGSSSSTGSCAAIGPICPPGTQLECTDGEGNPAGNCPVDGLTCSCVTVPWGSSASSASSAPRTCNVDSDCGITVACQDCFKNDENVCERECDVPRCVDNECRRAISKRVCDAIYCPAGSSSSSSSNLCGNAQIDGSEECDDGAPIPSRTDRNGQILSGCNADCTLKCGDGVVDPECTMASIPNSITNALMALSICGDYFEYCDDGNNDDDDGCSADCRNELCGDGTLQTELGEQCDDGNTVDPDSCHDDCRNFECGNGVQEFSFLDEFNEQCDTNPVTLNNGQERECRDDCTFCGDGIVQEDEECDDQNPDPTAPFCTNECKYAVCGNNIREAVEECDDGNTDPFDGCRDCLIESCGGSPYYSPVECGINEDGEEVGDPPDGPPKPDDVYWCRASIPPQENQPWDTGGRCMWARCEDNIIDPYIEGEGVTARVVWEECDIAKGMIVTSPFPTGALAIGQPCYFELPSDGITCAHFPGDGCDGECKEEVCGDGIMQTGLTLPDGTHIGMNEECDDGNTDDGDGCSTFCNRETGSSVSSQSSLSSSSSSQFSFSVVSASSSSRSSRSFSFSSSLRGAAPSSSSSSRTSFGFSIPASSSRRSSSRRSSAFSFSALSFSSQSPGSSSSRSFGFSTSSLASLSVSSRSRSSFGFSSISTSGQSRSSSSRSFGFSSLSNTSLPRSSRSRSSFSFSLGSGSSASRSSTSRSFSFSTLSGSSRSRSQSSAQNECLNCAACGQGIFNTCDRAECEALGACIFIDTGLLSQLVSANCVPDPAVCNQGSSRSSTSRSFSLSVRSGSSVSRSSTSRSFSFSPGSGSSRSRSSTSRSFSFSPGSGSSVSRSSTSRSFSLSVRSGSSLSRSSTSRSFSLSVRSGSSLSRSSTSRSFSFSTRSGSSTSRSRSSLPDRCLACENCGAGLFNLCERGECQALGDCLYVEGFLSGSCVPDPELCESDRSSSSRSFSLSTRSGSSRSRSSTSRSFSFSPGSGSSRSGSSVSRSFSFSPGSGSSVSRSSTSRSFSFSPGSGSSVSRSSTSRSFSFSPGSGSSQSRSSVSRSFSFSSLRGAAPSSSSSTSRSFAFSPGSGSSTSRSISRSFAFSPGSGSSTSRSISRSFAFSPGTGSSTSTSRSFSFSPGAGSSSTHSGLSTQSSTQIAGASSQSSRGPWDEYLLVAGIFCGDGILNTENEECDDRNSRDFDGCNARCQLERGICGDGIVQRALGEKCEPSLHDDSQGFGCNAVTCQYESAFCGNALQDPGEQCDEGAANTLSPAARCRPDCTLARCGDGIHDGIEQCDDGNLLYGDGCDDRCRDETRLPIAPSSDNARSQAIAQVPASSVAGRPTQPIGSVTPPATPTHAPVGDTGPGAVILIASGAAAGYAWVRRRRGR